MTMLVSIMNNEWLSVCYWQEMLFRFQWEIEKNDLIFFCKRMFFLGLYSGRRISYFYSSDMDNFNLGLLL